METYIWTLVVVMSLEAAGKMFYLSQGRLPERTLGVFVFDLFIGVCLAVWGIVVLLT